MIGPGLDIWRASRYAKQHIYVAHIVCGINITQSLSSDPSEVYCIGAFVFVIANLFVRCKCGHHHLCLYNLAVGGPIDANTFRYIRFQSICGCIDIRIRGFVFLCSYKINANNGYTMDWHILTGDVMLISEFFFA